MSREDRFRQAREAIVSIDRVDAADIRRDANDVPASIRVHLKVGEPQSTTGMTETLKHHELKLCLADAIRDHLVVGVAPLDEEVFGE